MPVKNHIHTYVKYKRRPGHYRCAAPDCTHFIDRESIIGKYSLCTQCGAQFILDYDDAKLVQPRCLNCGNTKRARAWRAGQAALRNVVNFSIGDGFPVPEKDS